MSKITLFSLLLLSIACSTKNSPSTQSVETVKSAEFRTIVQDFDIEFQIDKLDNEHFNLTAAIELDSGSYIISPYSQDTTYGHFAISIQATENLVLDGLPSETPASVGEYDPIVDQIVNFVRQNTIYKQKVKLLTQTDFEVSGIAWFLIEPSCIPFDVKFNISSRAGVLKVVKTKISPSKEYKL